MTIEAFVGTTFDDNKKYEKAVDKMGGPTVFRSLIPFSEETLRAAYAEDRNLNSCRTPLRKWDDATGISMLPMHPGGPWPVLQCRGLGTLLMAYGVTNVSLANCVSLLKTAAIMLIGEEP